MNETISFSGISRQPDKPADKLAAMRKTVGILVAILLVSASPALAKGLMPAESGCQVNIPDDWTINSRSQPPSYTIDGAQANNIRIVTVQSKPTANSTLAHDLKDAVSTTPNMTLVSSGPQKVNGIDFYVLKMVYQVPNVTPYTSLMYVYQTAGRDFTINLDGLGIDPENDPTLQAVIHSFTILN